jgi:hypothetical protein
MDLLARGELLKDDADAGLTSLIGRSPDSDLDVERLKRLANGRHTEEVAVFCQAIRTSDLRREVALHDLLHGLELVEPISFWDLLDSRAVNLLRRSEFASWTALCRANVCTIEDIHGAGPRVVDSTVAGMAKEWADAYLRRWGVPGAAGSPAPAHQLHPVGPASGLAELSLAFERLEAQPGFDVFALRLVPNGRPPTYRELAEPSGRSTQAVSAKRSRIRRHLQRQMRDPAWPIAAAVRYIEERIGSLARPSEINSLFASLQRESGALGRDKPGRRTLLLWLGGYLVTEEWVLSRDLDVITAALLDALVGSSSCKIDHVATYLAKLGVREHLCLLWLASQSGYRIVDGKLFPAGGR